MGVGRASVVRTAQTLGYDGYPQLRVALARERVVSQPAGEVDDGALGVVRAGITRFGGGLANIAAALTEEVVEQLRHDAEFVDLPERMSRQSVRNLWPEDAAPFDDEYHDVLQRDRITHGSVGFVFCLAVM